MGKTRRNMEVIDIKLIYPSSHNLSIKEDKTQLLQNLILAHGQTKIIQVRKVGELFECFEGRQILEAMKRMDFEEVYACNHGEMEDNDSLKIYYELEALKTKFDVLECAKLFKGLSDKYSVLDLSKNVDMDIKEIKDMIKLLEFDWNSMLNKKNNINQVSMFGDE